MPKTYRKNIMRTVYSTRSRFLAIFAIVALGVGFLAGLQSTTPDMRYSGDVYFDDAALFDVRVTGTLGLSDADVTALASLEDVEAVMPVHSVDALLSPPDGDVLVTRVVSMPVEAAEGDGENYLNRVTVVEGRLPLRAGEAVMVQGVSFNHYSFGVGDVLTVGDEQKDDFETDTLKIVGVVTSAAYFSAEKEAATVGNGTVMLVLYANNDAFTADYYSDIYLSIRGAKEINCLTDAYDTLSADAVDTVEGIADARCTARRAEVLETGEKELADAETEYNDAKTEADEELADAWQKILDGRKEIKDGEAKLADAAKEIKDGEQQISDNQFVLDAGAADAAAQFADAEKRLADAQNTITTQRTQADAAQAALGLTGAAQTAFDALRAHAAADANMAPMLQQLQAYGENAAALQQQLAALNPADPEYAAKAAALGQQLADIQAAVTALQASASYATYTQDFAALAVAMGANPANLANPTDPLVAAVAVTQGTLDAGQKTLDDQRAAYLEQKGQVEAKLADGRQKLAEARQTLADAKAEYTRGVNKLNDAKQELANGEADYETAKADAEHELADAWQKIEDAREELQTLEMPKWYVQDRTSNVGYNSFTSNILKVEAIAKVFPVFFFLVAALVALTTMTRMVEEDRLQIGTLKALGYRGGAIMSKYLLYALSASLLGSIAGVAVGIFLFPTVIWNAYTMMYTLPKLHCLFQPRYVLTASLVAIACTMLATLNACWATLREKPAALMLPRVPKAGKRILLERISFIWQHMKFTHKVTARNLFRYKKRFFMTTIGIAGCTALLVTGFGLHDSISDIVYKQFGEIDTYDSYAIVREEEDLYSDEVQAKLNDKTLVAEWLPVHQEKCTNTFGADSFNTYIFVTQNAEKAHDFITFRQRLSHAAVPFEEDSVVITEKMSERTGLGIGSSMTLENKDGETATFTVTGITENYVENYVYMTNDTYTNGFGNAAALNMVLLHAAEEADADRVANSLLATDGIISYSNIDTLKESFSNMMSKIDIIVVVLIISAASLAFVVVYNLTNINIEERIKEIATIKVLGFRDKEVYGYVFRESRMLTLIGTAFGLVLGVALHAFVIHSVEVDVVMFGRTVSVLSYVYSALLTILFSSLVNLVMRKKLRNISMVESMKAPE